MVEPINTSQARPRIVRPGEDTGIASGSPSAAGKTNLTAATPAGDSVSLSPAAQTVPAELKEAGPPMDLEIVKRIKDAIAEGKYPIDLEKITESLFQDYLELMG